MEELISRFKKVARPDEVELLTAAFNKLTSDEIHTMTYLMGQYYAYAVRKERMNSEIARGLNPNRPT